MGSIPQSMHDARAALLGPGWLRDDAERLTYGYDNSRKLALPDAVALPTTREQVLALVRACREHAVPLVARGRGTNTTGASVPVEAGGGVSFERSEQSLVGNECVLACSSRRSAVHEQTNTEHKPHTKNRP